jgi:spore coat-associated protein N
MTFRQTRTWAMVLVVALTLIGLIADADQTTATFTATTQNPGNQFITATLSLTNDKSAAGALVNISNLVPGDTATRTVTLTNTGNIPFTYSFAASQANNTLLWSDATNGLQVTVTHGVTTLYTGALKNMGTLAGPGTVATGGTDAITFLFSLPVSAGNTFQTLTQDLTVTYTATQLAGTAR